ncbi:MAG: putative quinol monooxygenase [Desulfatiglandaceae bacterium]
MIHVIASIRVKEGKVSEFLDIFKANLPHVRKESGCVEYFPALDIDADLPSQILDKNVVTIIEKWDSPKALHHHLSAPHMLAYKQKTADIVRGVSLKILQEA